MWPREAKLQKLPSDRFAHITTESNVKNCNIWHVSIVHIDPSQDTSIVLGRNDRPIHGLRSRVFSCCCWARRLGRRRLQRRVYYTAFGSIATSSFGIILTTASKQSLRIDSQSHPQSFTLRKNVKSFRSRKAHRAALISVSLTLSQTPVSVLRSVLVYVPAFAGTHCAYTRGMTRLSWPRWLVTHACRRSPIQVLTGPGVD